MWFEILPTAGIITVALTIPQFFPAVLNYAVRGNVSNKPYIIQVYYNV